MNNYCGMCMKLNSKEPESILAKYFNEKAEEKGWPLVTPDDIGSFAINTYLSSGLSCENIEENIGLLNFLNEEKANEFEKFID